ncbi:sodium:solute symporter family protein [Streptomyces purpurogeneiscleroticus]|uniref:sodium:solute symporter family protein n=1 Tax=Streptomyces purpurogeneiscleroticus TaxID=68259 RepID=UPI001CBFF77F|nr:sodium:solute symporter family protein [Streptomyces purpurogeneiscleroticus]MBZ4020238.1 SSS family transporter [Streptomyces purpurogeneiscleroticus]
MTAAIFFGVMAVSVLVAFSARRGMKNMSIGEYLVGGRSFPPWLLYFLAVGEIYSIGTMIGFPAGIYAGGASYGIWFLGYILLAYPLGYYIAPLIWRAGVRYDAMTIPDVFGRHFRSRSLELVTAGALLLALVPWGQYQFIGMQVVLQALGLPISPVQSVILAGVIAFLYLAVSGVRSPAFVAILKDVLMVLGIVVAGVVAVTAGGGPAEVFGPHSVPRAQMTMSGSPMVFALTTIVFQSVTFYLGFSAAYIFTAKSERAIKSSTVWMPVYMLMYPFLVATAYFAFADRPDVKDPNTVFMAVVQDRLPDWLVGVVAAGAGLSGVLVLAVTALTIGGIVSRNLAPNIRPEAQRRTTTAVVAVFLVAAAVLTLTASTLMLTVLNLTYYLLGQLVPGWLALMFFRRVQPWAVSAGMLGGIAASIVLYVTDPGLGGINAGLIAVGFNCVLMFGLSRLRPGPATEPVSVHPRVTSTQGVPSDTR